MNIMSRTHDMATAKELRDERQHGRDDAREEARVERVTWRRWLLEDSPYIAMLLLAVMGVAMRLPVSYWLVITPVYAIICIAAGWRHFDTRESHRLLITTQVLNWLALIVAIYVLYNVGVQGVLNTNASSLSMLTLLALGTFMAGLQARVWRICALGAILFAVVPAIAWLDQSVVILFAATVLVLAIGAFTWWIGQRRDSTV